MRVLLVDKAICRNDFPVCEGQIVRTESADDGLLIVRHEQFDLVIVDTGSLSEDGFAFIRRLRSTNNDTPLIALVGHQSSDRVRALGLGADDAVANPIDREELQSRIGAIVRRHRDRSQPMMKAGDLYLFTDMHQVRVKGLPLDLTGKEYSTLELLVFRKGQIVTRDMFLTHLYQGEEEPEPKLIEVFICKLRRKLNAVGAVGLISTVWGHGYTIHDPNKMQPHTDPGGQCADQVVTLRPSATARPSLDHLPSNWKAARDNISSNPIDPPRSPTVH